MKRVSKILLVTVFFAAVTAGYSGTVDSPYEVGTWRGFRQAAITYTFDDNCSNQFAIAIPMFNEFGFNLTMYPVINWMSSSYWTALQTAAAQGHEVGCHTVSHPSLSGLSIEEQTTELVDSQNTINSHITPNQCFTIAYPYCNPSDASLTATYYIAGRTCSGQIVPSTPSNFLQISSIICGSQGAVKTTANFISKNTSAASSNGWVVYLIHGIDSDGGYSPLPSTTLEESLEYLDDNRDIYWVSTFSNAARYIKERNDISVTESSSSDTSITLQVTDTLDDSIFDYPVTIRRPLPENWPGANVLQNGQPVDSNIATVGSTSYIMFDVVPDGGDVVIKKQLDAPTGLKATVDANTVMLNWNDCNETGSAGYNAYCATWETNYDKLNSLLVNTSDYNDVNVPLDTTYYYAFTAVDTNSFESDYSNETVVFGGPYGDFSGNNIVETEELSVFF